MNELIKTTPEYKAALSAYLQSSGTPLLIFRQGEYSTGETTVALGTRFVAKPLDHRIGWQRWAEGKPAESRMGYLHEGFIVPDRATLGFLDEKQWEIDSNGKARDPWQSSVSIPLIADDNEEFLFVTGSWGGHVGLVRLQKAYRADGSRRDPLIELSTERHKNQFGGVNQRPVFNVISWVNATPAQAALPAKRTEGKIINDRLPDFDSEIPF